MPDQAPDDQTTDPQSPAPTPAGPRYLSAAISLVAGSDGAPTIAAQGGSPVELADMLERAAGLLRASADPDATRLG